MDCRSQPRNQTPKTHGRLILDHFRRRCPVLVLHPIGLNRSPPPPGTATGRLVQPRSRHPSRVHDAVTSLIPTTTTVHADVAGDEVVGARATTVSGN